MRLVIDGLSARQGGGQTYLYNLLTCFPHAGDELWLLAPPSFRLEFQHPDVRLIRFGAWAENPLLRFLWQRFALPRLLTRLRANVLFCPGGLVGARAPKGCPTATMFRNMIPFDPVQRARYGYGYARLRNWVLEHLFLSSMTDADLVFFLSEYSRQVVEARAPGRIHKAVVISHGVASRFHAEAPPPLLPAWMPSSQYLLYVSSIDVYKAQCEVVRAYALLRARRPTTQEILVLAGPENNRGYARAVRMEIARHRLDGLVVMVGAVPYAELPALYRYATAHIFASECENCPNILLEAMASARPVLSSNLPPMPAFGGDAVKYFDPRRPEELAQCLMELLDSQEKMTDLGRRAAERASRYDWCRTAHATWEALSALGAEGTRR